MQWAAASALSARLDLIDLAVLLLITFTAQTAAAWVHAVCKSKMPSHPKTEQPRLPSQRLSASKDASTSPVEMGDSGDSLERSHAAERTERGTQTDPPFPGSGGTPHVYSDLIHEEKDYNAPSALFSSSSAKDDVKNLRSTLSQLVKMIHDTENPWLRINSTEVSSVRVFRHNPEKGTRLRIKVEAELDIDLETLSRAIGEFTNHPTLETLNRNRRKNIPNDENNMERNARFGNHNRFMSKDLLTALRLIIPARQMLTISVTERTGNGGYIKLSRSCDHALSEYLATKLGKDGSSELQIGIIYIAADVLEAINGKGGGKGQTRLHSQRSHDFLGLP
ncbi:hypothetical protein HDU67_008358 [Dinochytrium kinnereticum]|nr:hypothetical protein HDU67_008358 [Dinochytrium kinnereticum]